MYLLKKTTQSVCSTFTLHQWSTFTSCLFKKKGSKHLKRCPSPPPSCAQPTGCKDCWFPLWKWVLFTETSYFSFSLFCIFAVAIAVDLDTKQKRCKRRPHTEAALLAGAPAHPMQCTDSFRDIEKKPMWPWFCFFVFFYVNLRLSEVIKRRNECDSLTGVTRSSDAGF